jgi:16S rRNA (guanine527-N7)-methyltransferase
MRIESLATDNNRPKVEVVLARALAPLPRLLNYAAPFLANGAVGLFHKGQDIDAELTGATKCWKLKFIKHSGLIDSNGVILEVKEALRVQP